MLYAVPSTMIASPIAMSTELIGQVPLHARMHVGRITQRMVLAYVDTLQIAFTLRVLCFSSQFDQRSCRTSKV